MDDGSDTSSDNYTSDGPPYQLKLTPIGQSLCSHVDQSTAISSSSDHSVLRTYRNSSVGFWVILSILTGLIVFYESIQALR